MNTLYNFTGRVVFVGFGSIGQASLPLILRHLNVDPKRVFIITGDDRGKEIAEKYGVSFSVNPLTPDNFRQILTPVVGEGDFLLNVSVDVSSVSLVEFCWERGAMYQDTCIEPWAGGYVDPKLAPATRSNYSLRAEALALRDRMMAQGRTLPTAIMTHGANPGVVSHFIKRALLTIAADTGVETAVPKTRAEWAALAEKLSIKTIHVAERDTQVSESQPKRRDEFVNTWSIDGFISEGCQPAELGWGTHERHWPEDGVHHTFGNQCAIYLMRPGASVKVRSWTPMEGPFHAFLITHNESVSTADYFTALNEDGSPRYRPTVHYSYHPCDAAVVSLHELAGKNWKEQSVHRVMENEISSGIDELGVLLCGHAKGAYWYGSQVTIHQARERAPHNNATSIQVSSTVLAGMVWALENPGRGMVEPEELDFERILEIAGPYMEPLVGAYTDWTPLQDRGILFPEDLDLDDPWQFKNIRV